MLINAKQLMSSQQVAEYLQVSYSTVRRLMADGELRPFKVRGSLRYSSDDINSYLKNNRIIGSK